MDIKIVTLEMSASSKKLIFFKQGKLVSVKKNIKNALDISQEVARIIMKNRRTAQKV
jgi:hypothetical protein